MIAFLLVALLAVGTPAPLAPFDTLAECKAQKAVLEKQYADQIKADGVVLVCYEAK